MERVEEIVEVPRGGVVKRRADGTVDFISPVPCPFNYGSAPSLPSGDGDPLDVVLLGPTLAKGARQQAPVWGVVTVNRVILKPEYTVDDLQERVAVLCENVKTYPSETGFVGGLVALNTGNISNEGSTIGQAVESDLKGKEALIITFWNSFEDHEASHRSETFQPLFQEVIEVCENGNEEIAYDMLWSGKAYDEEQAKAARESKAKHAA